MKLSISAAAFSDAAAWANRARDPRPNIPILTGLLLEAETDKLRVSGFNYETSARAVVPAEADTPFRAVIPGGVLLEILGKLGRKNAHVDLDIQGSRAILTSGKATFNLSLLPEAGFPALPDMPDLYATIDGEALAAGINRAKFAAGRDDALPILMAVHLVDNGPELIFQSTDRYRMTHTVVPWQRVADSPAEAEWLVKVGTLETVGRLAAGEMQMFANDSVVGFQSGNRTLTTLLVDGDYPKIASLFPAHTPYGITVDRDALLAGAELASIVAERNTPLRLTMMDGEMQMDAGTGEDAQAAEYVECQVEGAERGEKIIVGFNPHFLLEALRSMPEGPLRIGVTMPSKPILFESGASADEYRHIIMPVRIAGK